MKTRGFKPPINRKRQRAFDTLLIRRLSCAFAAAGLLGVSEKSEAQEPAAGGIPAAGVAPARDNSPVGVASRESARRLEAVKAAQELLTAAEYDRSENRNKEALEKLDTAFRSVMNVPAARETREAIFGRYQKAALAYAGELVDQARWQEAQAVLTAAMGTARDAGKLPAQVDPGLRKLMEQLKGDYFNKSMTPEHLDAITLVERNLKEANVLIGAGDFDGARERYHVVLNLDKYNKAARRGLEKLEQFVMEYQRVAYDQARATKLREVAQGWDLQAPPTLAANLPVPGGLTIEGTGQAELQKKLKRIIIPQVQFQDTPLRTVIDYLSQKAQELDGAAVDPNSRGLNIIVDTAGGPPVDNEPVTIRLNNAPLGTVLEYVTQQVGMKYRIDEFAVTIIPQNAVDDTSLIIRKYDVPPGFLSSEADGGGGGAPLDPFAPQGGGGAGAGTLVKRITAREFLEKRGVTFPEGASAQMTGNSSLVVRNTPDNIELIESFVLSARESGNKLVKVDFKMITIAEDTLKEMGFDMLMGPFNMGGGEKVFGTGGTFGNQQGNKVGTDFPFGGTGGRPVTGGLRTGNTSATQSIEDIINRDNPTQAISTAAPGIFGLAGVFTDPQFQFVWRALNQQKGMDRVCSASVVTRPGERALIRQVREFIYPTEYDAPEIPNSVGIAAVGGGLAVDTGDNSAPVTPSHPAAFDMRELGKIMEVEPVIGPDGTTVNLNISTDVSDFVGFINYGSPITQVQNSQQLFGFILPQFPGFIFLFLGQGPGQEIVVTENRILMPVFDAVKNSTNVSVYDGQTVAIGGLIGEQIDLVEDKVPVIGDAPVVGKLFRTNIEEHKRKALVLFVTVHIQDGAGRPLNDLSSQFQNGTQTAQSN